MKCSHCGHQNTASSKYCSACGVRVGVVCPVCQHPNEAGGRFCAACGRPLEGQPAGALPTPYMPESLAQRMLVSRAAMEGERKHVTILFADLKASMELLASRDAEDARALLDPVLERMMEAVHHHEGVVNQVMGDGIMALFGAPLAHEDPAVPTAWRCRSASASTPATLSCARSAAICAWTTPRWTRPRTSPPGWNS